MGFVAKLAQGVRSTLLHPLHLSLILSGHSLGFVRN
jgi:hypothetical protein